jgi:CheY-like chemotaxis protein
MQSAAPELEPAPSERPLFILLLEDNELDARLIRTQLEEAGLVFHLERVDSREEFLRALGRAAAQAHRGGAAPLGGALPAGDAGHQRCGVGLG